MIRAIYPGSFDPMTYGHLDIIKRSAELFDEVIVTAMINPQKKPLFSTEEKKSLIEQSVKDIPNVKVAAFEGLLVDFVEQNNANVIVKGLRAVSDFEMELQMAALNRKLDDVETVFMMTATEHSFLSSTLVKEVSRLGGDISSLVPEHVVDALNKKFRGPNMDKSTSAVFEIFNLLDKFEDKVENLDCVPFTKMVMLRKNEILDIISEVNELIPEEIYDARRIIQQQKDISENEENQLLVDSYKISEKDIIEEWEKFKNKVESLVCVPSTENVMIGKKEILDIILQIHIILPVELHNAKRIIKKQKEILEERTQAESI